MLFYASALLTLLFVFLFCIITGRLFVRVFDTKNSHDLVSRFLFRLRFSPWSKISHVLSSWSVFKIPDLYFCLYSCHTHLLFGYSSHAEMGYRDEINTSHQVYHSRNFPRRVDLLCQSLRQIIDYLGTFYTGVYHVSWIRWWERSSLS